MLEPHTPQEPSPVTEYWGQAVQGFVGLALLVGVVAMFHFYASSSVVPNPEDLAEQVHRLSSQVDQLRRQQEMPAVVLDRYRNSIGYVFGIYRVGFGANPSLIRARVSGTGFIVAEGLLATNRHVAEPWFGDTEAEDFIKRGATPSLESLVVFFPGSPTPITLSPASVSSKGDLAVLRLADPAATSSLPVLPLAKAASLPGELVTVVGYPMGIAGMVAKSPNGIFERMAYRHNDINAASELAALSLIRPSATWGHLGDVVGDKLIYDAPTAHGGSGGPVFNSKGEVIGVNSAYMDGFSGGTIGVSVSLLKPLVQAARQFANDSSVPAR
jgi:S1-C subfamily serine protease